MVELPEILALNPQIGQLPPLVAVFVGATNGIGKSTMLTFVRYARTPRVYFVARDAAVGELLVEEMLKINPDGEYMVLEGDVSTLRQIDELCEQLLEREKHINLLFQSQGTLDMVAKTIESERLITSVSYYGRMRFIQKLLPLLRRAETLRRVVVVLAGSKEGRVDLTDLGGNKLSLWHFRGHFGSCTTLMLEYFAEQAPEVSFVHSFPGYVPTTLARTLPQGMGAFVKLFSFSAKHKISLEETGERHAFLATSARYAPMYLDHVPAARGVPLSAALRVAVSTTGRVSGGVYSVDAYNDSRDPHSVSMISSLHEQNIGAPVTEFTLGMLEDLPQREPPPPKPPKMAVPKALAAKLRRRGVDPDQVVVDTETGLAVDAETEMPVANVSMDPDAPPEARDVPIQVDPEIPPDVAQDMDGDVVPTPTSAKFPFRARRSMAALWNKARRRSSSQLQRDAAADANEPVPPVPPLPAEASTASLPSRDSAPSHSPHMSPSPSHTGSVPATGAPAKTAPGPPHASGAIPSSAKGPAPTDPSAAGPPHAPSSTTSGTTGPATGGTNAPASGPAALPTGAPAPTPAPSAMAPPDSESPHQPHDRSRKGGMKMLAGSMQRLWPRKPRKSVDDTASRPPQEARADGPADPTTASPPSPRTTAPPDQPQGSAPPSQPSLSPSRNKALPGDGGQAPPPRPTLLHQHGEPQQPSPTYDARKMPLGVPLQTKTTPAGPPTPEDVRPSAETSRDVVLGTSRRGAPRPLDEAPGHGAAASALSVRSPVLHALPSQGGDAQPTAAVVPAHPRPPALQPTMPAPASTPRAPVAPGARPTPVVASVPPPNSRGTPVVTPVPPPAARPTPVVAAVPPPGAAAAARPQASSAPTPMPVPAPASTAPRAVPVAAPVSRPPPGAAPASTAPRAVPVAAPASRPPPSAAPAPSTSSARPPSAAPAPSTSSARPPSAAPAPPTSSARSPSPPPAPHASALPRPMFVMDDSDEVVHL